MSHRSNRRRAAVRQTHGHLLAADPFGDAIVAEAAIDFIAAIDEASAELIETEKSLIRGHVDLWGAGVALRVRLTLAPRSASTTRVFILRRPEIGVYLCSRRSRALMRLTTPERHAFVRAIKTHPRAAIGQSDHMHSARNAFTRALRAAHLRDKAAAHGC